MRYIYTFLLALALAQAQIQQAFASELVRVYPGVEVEEHKLDNGLKVFIKSNDFDEGEVFVKIFFHSGYAHEESIKEKISAFVSFRALQETGLINHKSKKLDDPFDELLMYVSPTSKGIEAKIPTHCFDEFIEYIATVFEDGVISDEAYAKALNSIAKNSKDISVKNKYNTSSKLYEAYFGQAHFSLASPGEAIKHSDKKTAQNYLNKTFRDNEAFSIVVVGDIDPKEATAALEKYLPKKKYVQKKPAVAYKASETPSEKYYRLKGSESKDPVSTMVYSLKTYPEADDLNLFYSTLCVIENRLKTKLSSIAGRKGFRVTPEFPYYPASTYSWVRIKFYVDPLLNKPALAAIENQIKDLVENGPTAQEIEEVKNSLSRAARLLNNDNYFWLTAIGDYELNGWDLTQIQTRTKRDPTITQQAIQTYMKKSLALNDPLNVLMD